MYRQGDQPQILYLKYSRIVRRIYQRYSEIIEPFGMDENWIQLPFTNDVEGIGFQTAEEIRRTVENETGLTVSIGVSFSKIFAKLGLLLSEDFSSLLSYQEQFSSHTDTPAPGSAQGNNHDNRNVLSAPSAHA